jgi:serine phosphatase RsbU (regulator of sigma subunit)
VFEGIEKKFEKGDVMVMISDGLPELPNHENELLDYPVIQDCIKEHVKKSADDIKNALIELSDQWANGLMNPDDITIVVIKKVA